MKFSEQEIIREGLRTLEIERNELQSVIERIGPNFAQAVELLLEARKIVVSGVGKFRIIAQKIAATISSTGFPALFMHRWMLFTATLELSNEVIAPYCSRKAAARKNYAFGAVSAQPRRKNHRNCRQSGFVFS
jgi:hypothetical protein